MFKGSFRSIICDLQRQNSCLITNDLFNLVKELKCNSINSVKKLYDETSVLIIDDYIKFLLKNEFGFITNDQQYSINFPEIDDRFENPSMITNGIFEVKTPSILAQIELQINELGCRDIVLILNTKLNKVDFQHIGQIFRYSIVKSISIISEFHIGINDALLKNIEEMENRFVSLTFYNSSNECKSIDANKFRYLLSFIETENVPVNCGKVDLKYFNTNLPKVLEATNHNSCLHKKISIDSEGNIRNCPSMPQSFGNIKNTTLKEALNHKDFKKYWNLTKDHIEVCKDCEFRYICTDCRAYTERTHHNAEGLDTSKPLKCGYNPYTGEWQEWSTNPLKEKAINFYGMQDLVKKNS